MAENQEPQFDTERFTKNKKEVEKPDFHVDANPNSHIRHVIGVVSGKGGVGKSFVTASLACRMNLAGYKVGVLDADVTGPSIPKMYGVHGPAYADERGTIPVRAEDSTKIMSVNLLLDNEETPVVWRGPVIAGTVKEFWSGVNWGDIDYLFVDMPPGTGDVPLTVFQSLPVDGVIIVTSPQELVRMIVKKAYNMARMMEIPVLGLVENYSYLECPDCGKHIRLFGQSHIEEVAAELNVPLLGKMPLNPEYAETVDRGRVFEIQNPFLDKGVEVLEALNQ